jgi:YegS/Rv2252/BmrU family lipid kinase
MCSLQKFAIVVNPKSGSGKSQQAIPRLKDLEKAGKIIRIFEWKKRDEVAHLLEQVFSWEPDVVVAVGGDGTVNLIGSSLIHKNIPMGIIPTGSGNGLARHLGIPMSIEKAVAKLLQPEIMRIDAGKINEYFFFCTCGLGFDAIVANRFAGLKNRGFLGYSRESFLAIRQLKPEQFDLHFNGEEHIFKALILTFANAAQYGNNAFIAPKANLMDGKVDLTVIEKTNFLKIPSLLYKLFSKTIDKDSSVHTFSSESFSIRREKKGFLHFDGETATCPEKINISSLPSALMVLV